MDQLERAGCEVLDLSGVGRGAPDLLVYRHGKFALVEVKAGSARLRPKQAAFQLRWPVHVVRCQEHVTQLLQAFGVKTVSPGRPWELDESTDPERV